MLASADTVRVVADALRRHNVRVSVVDPVMVSTSGFRLLPNEAVDILRTDLLPVSTVLTPNLPEAKLLLESSGIGVPEPRNLQDLVDMTRLLQKLGPSYVLLKGGHLPLTKDESISKAESDHHVVVNVLCGEGEPVILKSNYIGSKNTHGTGCSLAC